MINKIQIPNTLHVTPGSTRGPFSSMGQNREKKWIPAFTEMTKPDGMTGSCDELF